MKNELLVLNGENYELTAETNNQLVALETQIKALTDVRDEVRKLIQKEMEEKGIYKMENDELSITYIAANEREIFDSKRFKEDHPYAYHEYMKTSKVAPSVRIKVK